MYLITRLAPFTLFSALMAISLLVSSPEAYSESISYHFFSKTPLHSPVYIKVEPSEFKGQIPLPYPQLELDREKSSLQPGQRLLWGRSIKAADSPGAEETPLVVELEYQQNWLESWLQPGKSYVKVPLGREEPVKTSRILKTPEGRVVYSDNVESLTAPSPSPLEEDNQKAFSIMLMEMHEEDEKKTDHPPFSAFQAGSNNKASLLNSIGGGYSGNNDEDFKPGFGSGGGIASNEIEIMMVSGLSFYKDRFLDDHDPEFEYPTNPDDTVIVVIDSSGTKKQQRIISSEEFQALFQSLADDDEFANWLEGSTITLQLQDDWELALPCKNSATELLTVPGIIGCMLKAGQASGGASGTSGASSEGATGGQASGSSGGWRAGSYSGDGSGGEQSPEASLRCEQCRMVFSSRSALRYHMRRHSEVPPATKAARYATLAEAFSTPTTVALPSYQPRPDVSGPAAVASTAITYEKAFEESLTLLSRLDQVQADLFLIELGHYTASPDYGVKVNEYMALTKQGSLKEVLTRLRNQIGKSVESEVPESRANRIMAQAMILTAQTLGGDQLKTIRSQYFPEGFDAEFRRYPLTGSEDLMEQLSESVLVKQINQVPLGVGLTVHEVVMKLAATTEKTFEKVMKKRDEILQSLKELDDTGAPPVFGHAIKVLKGVITSGEIVHLLLVFEHKDLSSQIDQRLRALWMNGGETLKQALAEVAMDLTKRHFLRNPAAPDLPEIPHVKLEINAHLRTIYTSLLDAVSQWEAIARNLQLKNGKIDEINEDKKNIREKLISTLKIWMYGNGEKPVTLKVLYLAVRSVNGAAAETLRQAFPANSKKGLDEQLDEKDIPGLVKDCQTMNYRYEELAIALLLPTHERPISSSSNAINLERTLNAWLTSSTAQPKTMRTLFGAIGGRVVGYSRLASQLSEKYSQQ